MGMGMRNPDGHGDGYGDGDGDGDGHGHGDVDGDGDGEETWGWEWRWRWTNLNGIGLDVKERVDALEVKCAAEGHGWDADRMRAGRSFAMDWGSSAGLNVDRADQLTFRLLFSRAQSR